VGTDERNWSVPDAVALWARRVPPRLDKFVYDDENIHYVMLHLMCQSSGAFAQRFLDLPAKPERVSVVLEPEHGLFDLLFVVGQINHYCEVKVWATLSDTQFARQTDFLKTRHAGGLYVLFTKAADAWPPDRVAAESGGQSRAIGANGLLSTLSSLEPDLASDYETS
jgi:hypothetical protein